jgi:hypothetical protein
MQSLLKISLKLHKDAIKSLDPAWRHADAINSRLRWFFVGVMTTNN